MIFSLSMFINKSEFLQMVVGKIPVLTKGPISLFLGGEEIMDVLGDEDPGKALFHLCIFSVIFQSSNSVYKKYRNRKLHSVTDYTQSLRTTFVNNVLNVYGLFLLIFCNCIFLVYLLRKAFNIFLTLSGKLVFETFIIY